MWRRCKLIVLFLLAVLPVLQAQDFVTRFKREFKNDTTLQVITVSPKMMEKVITVSPKTTGKSRTGIVGWEDILSKIDAMRIIVVDRDVQHYWKKAQELLQKNTHRFYRCFDASEEGVTNQLYVRRKNGVIPELVVFKCEDRVLKIVNLTGTMDEEFIRTLKEENGKEAEK